jgi:peptide deformylase
VGFFAFNQQLATSNQQLFFWLPMADELKIVVYPDPRLRKMSRPVAEFGPELAELAVKMLALMRTSQGVGLAAPQVGKNIRMFVMNATGKPEDDRVIVNPVLSEADGEETGEEGCLSIPDIKAQILRGKTMKLNAVDVNGKAIEELQSGYVARIWQHEIDHLNGTLILDRMGALAKMTHRKKLKEMEEEYAAAHPPKASPPAKAVGGVKAKKKSK